MFILGVRLAINNSAPEGLILFCKSNHPLNLSGEDALIVTKKVYEQIEQDPKIMSLARATVRAGRRAQLAMARRESAKWN